MGVRWSQAVSCILQGAMKAVTPSPLPTAATSAWSTTLGTPWGEGDSHSPQVLPRWWPGDLVWLEGEAPRPISPWGRLT